MTIASTGISTALRAFEDAVESPPLEGVTLGNWRWTLRQRMATLRDALIGESGDAEDGWLAARGGSAFRERNVLLGRLNDLGPQVLESADVEALRDELRRVVGDISHHLQRLNDLAYDEVELELGGSE